MPSFGLAGALGAGLWAVADGDEQATAKPSAATAPASRTGFIIFIGDLRERERTRARLPLSECTENIATETRRHRVKLSFFVSVSVSSCLCGQPLSVLQEVQLPIRTSS